MSITNLVKEGLHYPFGEKDKILKLGVFFVIMAVLNCILPYLFNSAVYPTNVTSIFGFILAIFQSLPTNNLLAIVTILLVSVILSLFISGYMIRVIKKALNNDISLPNFDNIGAMFIDGVKVLIITIVYQLIPIILMFVGFILMNQFIATENNMFLVGLLISFIGVIISIIMYIFHLIAINHFVAKDKQLNEALNFRDVFAVVKGIGFFRILATVIFTGLICGIIVCVAGGIVGFTMGLLSLIPGLYQKLIFGTIIIMALIISPFIFLFESRVFGSLYNHRA